MSDTLVINEIYLSLQSEDTFADRRRFPSQFNRQNELRSKPSPCPFGWLLLVLLTLSTAFATAGEALEAPKVASPSSISNKIAAAGSPWERIVMVGASVTAGFTASEPLGGSNTPLYRLSRYVDAALVVPHEPVRNFGNAFFFLQPEVLAQQQMDQALKIKPTLIIGVDFLFWFCYGEGNTDAERLQRFDQGLKLLESVKCPLVLGDIPDASAAVNGMLRPDQMPSARAMSEANRRLKEWAASRRHVVILKLSEFMRNTLANRSVRIRDYTLPDGQTRVLLQDDKLHSSPPGCAVLAFAILDAVQSTRQGISTEEFRRDPREIYRQALKSPRGAPGNPPKTVTPPTPAAK